jgi:hypothetical protein
MPHPPQFCTLRVSVHTLLQTPHPGAHPLQMPLMHCAPEGVQKEPHRPQLPGSACGFTQVPLHRISPAAHGQVPFVQLVQTAPQAPQLLVSVCSFTQAPLQTVSPVGQVQDPPWHVWPVAAH